jgi:hypothetical protein
MLSTLRAFHAVLVSMYIGKRRRHFSIAYAIGYVLLGAASVKANLRERRNAVERGPPRPPYSPLLLPPLLSDQSAYVALGDGVGSAIAVGDFTQDRYVDLVMADEPSAMRSLRVSAWRQREYVFQPVQQTWNSSEFRAVFSLDSMAELPLTSSIAGAAPLDANADGILDLLVSIEVQSGTYVGVILQGNGMGGFQPSTTLPDVGPDVLIMDGDNDLRSDIMFTSSGGGLAFYKNNPPGVFTVQYWNPYGSEGPSDPSAQRRKSSVSSFEDEISAPQLSVEFDGCRPVVGFGSHAFVDMNGDCLPDLVITTENCGMHVWLNSPFTTARASDGSTIPVGTRDAFWDLTLEKDSSRFVALAREVWDLKSGDGRAVFADFNGDGTTDVAVPNSHLSRIRLSLNEQADRMFGELCTSDPEWSLNSYDAMQNVRLADTTLGPSRSPATIHVGDYNYDGLLDLLIINADMGIVQLLEGTRSEEAQGFRRNQRSSASSVKSSFWREPKAQHQKVAFEEVGGYPVLPSLEDPVTAAFFDVDESGRQDIIVVQAHGTRLIWNSYNEVDDSEFFKVTSSNAIFNSTAKRKVTTRDHPFVPMPGNTVKISYGGHNGHEQHTCTQCPQAGFLALQSCTCLFGIRRIANYIEELSVGGGGAVHTWTALMPNAMAILWPVDGPSGRWRVAYFTKSRGQHMLGVVVVLASTLIILAVAIAYLHTAERIGERKFQLMLQHNFRA